MGALAATFGVLSLLAAMPAWAQSSPRPTGCHIDESALRARVEAYWNHPEEITGAALRAAAREALEPFRSRMAASEAARFLANYFTVHRRTSLRCVDRGLERTRADAPYSEFRASYDRCITPLEQRLAQANTEALALADEVLAATMAATRGIPNITEDSASSAILYNMPSRHAPSPVERGVFAIRVYGASSSRLESDDGDRLHTRGNKGQTEDFLRPFRSHARLQVTLSLLRDGTTAVKFPDGTHSDGDSAMPGRARELFTS